MTKNRPPAGTVNNLITSSKEPNCCVCEGKDFIDTFADLQRCASCGFVRYVPDDIQALSSLYDENYFHGKEYSDYLAEAPALRRSMRQHVQQMKRICALGGSLLEIGCAYGFFMQEARSSFSEVCGIDVCEGPVKFAREKSGLDAHAGDFLEYDFGDRRFDVICLWDTIEHLAQPDRFLARAAKLLKEGGFLFLTTGDLSSANARLRGSAWRQIHPPTHVSYFSRDTITRLAERVGFRVARIETASYYHTLQNILSTLQLRGGMLGRLSGVTLGLFGKRLVGRIGFWLNLGDIMFVACQKVASSTFSVPSTFVRT